MIKFGNLKLKNPFITASGCSGYGWDLYEMFPDIKWSAFTTKTITLKPREGNSPPRIFELEYGIVNRIGLENCGLDSFVEFHLPKLRKIKVPFIVSIYGNTLKEWEILVDRLIENNIRTIELNLSCPNLKGKILQENFNMCIKIVKSLSKKKVCLIPKLNAIHRTLELVEKFKNLGINSIICSNTIPASFIYNNKIYDGGLSGKCLKPVVLKVVKDIKNNFDIEVGACGGIYSRDDVLDYKKAGADVFVLGSVLFKEPDILKWLV